MAAARPGPGKGRARCFLLNTHRNPLPFWLYKLAMDLLLLFLPSYPAAPAPACAVPAHPKPLRRRESPTPGPSPSPPRGSSLRNLSLLIFFLAIWVLPTTPVHAPEPHYTLYSAQRVPTRILQSQHVNLLKMMTFLHKDTPICNKLEKLNVCTPCSNCSKWVL